MDSLALARFFSDFLSKYGGSKVEILGAKNSKIFNNMVVCFLYNFIWYTLYNLCIVKTFERCYYIDTERVSPMYK